MAQSPPTPLTRAKKRNRQIVPKMGLNSHCENARLKEP
jgi:hypothetical protein